MTDFHSHILPAIDDGSRDIDTSIKMLTSLASQGVTRVLATPHFCLSHGEIAGFIEKRDAAYERLCLSMQGISSPTILRGAEVLLSTELSVQEDLDKLCIEGTHCILLEMPYSSWKPWMINVVDEIQNRGFFPIMAHIERYFGFDGNKDFIEDLFSLDIAIQMNTGSIINRDTQKFALRLIKSELIDVLGTDTHNLTTRPPNYTDAFKIIRKKLGESYVQRIHQRGSEILGL
ncbi:MAG: hypothetical protein K0R90_1846 [Oscillospiraceae bacterium]|nr:hypothetical protein [Oscillospiraceae bacterium]